MPIVIRPEYMVRLELVTNTGFPEHPRALFVHVDVYRWGKTVAKQYLQDVNLAHSLIQLPIFAQGGSDAKFTKFLKFGGFEIYPDHWCVYDNKKQDVWIRKYHDR